MVDLRMTEFFYSQRPEELAEYRRLKAQKEVSVGNEKAEQLAESLFAEPVQKLRKKRQKRKKKRGILGGRLKGINSRIKGREKKK